jgi:hypothetical protein
MQLHENINMPSLYVMLLPQVHGSVADAGNNVGFAATQGDLQGPTSSQSSKRAGHGLLKRQL